MDTTAKILILEDDANFISYLTALLSSRYAGVLHAEDGVTGVELAQKELPNLILLDMMMPRMNGLEVAEALLERKDTALIPIIIFTATDFDPVTARLLKEQPNVKGFLDKKTSGPDVLLSEIARVLAG